MKRRFQDRREAGRLLGEKLTEYLGRADVLILGLPRGGVPVAFEVARKLGAPLDVFVVRKLGVPGHEELAMGAIASGGIQIFSGDVIIASHVSRQEIERVLRAEEGELARRESVYRGDRPAPMIAQQITILIDDGMATGASMRAAVAAVRSKQPARIVVAVPVVSRSTFEEFRSEVDHIVAVITPEDFLGVGEWYRDFQPTNDAEVKALLEQHESPPST